MAKEYRREILALIPARGGSKGIPRKNIKVVAGKPLIAYSIEQALASRFITRTIVSTDDPEIAQVAREFGAKVPFMRPGEFAQDLSPDIDVFRHALKWLRDRDGYACDLVVHLRPTGPVRRVELIDQAIELILNDPEADSLPQLNKFLTKFNPDFLGVRGETRETTELVDQLHIIVNRKQGNSNINHGGEILLINPQAKIQAYFSYPQQPDKLATDYQKIVSKNDESIKEIH